MTTHPSPSAANASDTPPGLGAKRGGQGEELGSGRAAENSAERKKGKVREQGDLFVVAQRAQPLLYYHKKVTQKG
jgi:hypothetical protein